uniref:Uncharacterized protein n=1 Tax=Trichogramma kaykai TaxID=54128 RepID=A0ABD2XK53_9HYME
MCSMRAECAALAHLSLSALSHTHTHTHTHIHEREVINVSSLYMQRREKLVSDFVGDYYEFDMRRATSEKKEKKIDRNKDAVVLYVGAYTRFRTAVVIPELPCERVLIRQSASDGVHIDTIG